MLSPWSGGTVSYSNASGTSTPTFTYTVGAHDRSTTPPAATRAASPR
jgi:hypothetical protein